MELECQPGTIEQWYEQAVRLDRNIRESRREEKEERKKRKTRRIEKEWKKIE